MTDILGGLGDELANTGPDLPGANSAYAIVFQCVAVVEYWAGSVIAGLQIPRDRAAEFAATGRVDDLIARVDTVRARLPEWVNVAVREGIRDRTVMGTTRPEVATATAEWVLTHLVRELAQHLGQLELTRDVHRARITCRHGLCVGAASEDVTEVGGLHSDGAGGVRHLMGIGVVLRSDDERGAVGGSQIDAHNRR